MNKRNEMENCGVTHTSQINREERGFQNLKAISIAKNHRQFLSIKIELANKHIPKASKQTKSLRRLAVLCKSDAHIKIKASFWRAFWIRVLLHLILLFIHLTSRLHVIHSLWKTFSLLLWLYSSYLPEQSGIKLLIQGSLNTAFITDLCKVWTEKNGRSNPKQIQQLGKQWSGKGGTYIWVCGSTERSYLYWWIYICLETFFLVVVVR